MFWKYTPLISQIDSLLETENVTLNAILDEDDVLQECRVQNAKLVNFLTTPENLLALVKYVTEDPPAEADDATKYKYPNIACELLTCDVVEINDALVKDDVHLDLLYAFLKVEHPLNPLTASFFVKVMGLLTQKKSERIFDYIKGKEDFLNLLLSHIGTSAIVDYLIKMLRDPEPDDMKNKYVEWVSEQGFVRNLLAGMEPSQDSDKHYHTSQCVCELIAMCRETLSQCQENADVSILLDSLESSSTVTDLLTYMFEDENPKESVLVNGLRIILMLFNKKKNESPGGVLEPGNLSSLVNENDLVRLAQAASNAVEAVLPKLPNFVSLLRNPPKQHYSPMPTTSGTLNPPMGATRLCIVSLIDALLSVSAPVANLAVYEYELLDIILDLFMSYPLNSFLHHSTCSIISTILVSGTPQEDSINKLQHQLLVDYKLIQRLLEAYEITRGLKSSDKGDSDVDNEKTESVKHQRHDGHIAHVFQIANILKDNIASGNHKDYLTELLENSDEELRNRWNDFISGPLSLSNESSTVDPLPNDDSLGNVADITRLGQEEVVFSMLDEWEMGFLEDEFDQQQQHDKFESLCPNKVSSLHFDLEGRDCFREEEDNLWAELSALSPRRNDGVGRDTRLAGFSSDNGDEESDPRVSAGGDDDEDDSSSDEEDLDSPIVIRQKPRTAASGSSSHEPSDQEAMDVDDADEWAVFDNRPRSTSKQSGDGEAVSMDTTPASRATAATGTVDANQQWAGFETKSDEGKKEDDGWADFASSTSAATPQKEENDEGWANFKSASSTNDNIFGGTNDENWAKFDDFRGSDNWSEAAVSKPWTALGSGGADMDTSSSSSEEEVASAEDRCAGKKRPTQDSDSSEEKSKPSTSPDRSNGPV